MWRNTAGLRDPSYQRAADLPGTLDDGFMRRVAGLLLAR